MAPFHGWGSTASRLEPLRGGSLLFTTKFPARILSLHHAVFHLHCVKSARILSFSGPYSRIWTEYGDLQCKCFTMFTRTTPTKVTFVSGWFHLTFDYWMRSIKFNHQDYINIKNWITLTRIRRYLSISEFFHIQLKITVKLHLTWNFSTTDHPTSMMEPFCENR